MFEFLKKLSVVERAKMKVMSEALNNVSANIDMLQELLQHPIRKKEIILEVLQQMKQDCNNALK